MGINIYASWPGMTDEEAGARITGFSVAHGHVGYLREAYHGGPYSTRVLVPEAFTEDDAEPPEDDPHYHGVEIKGLKMMGRLPSAIEVALEREAAVYGDKEAGVALERLRKAAAEAKPVDVISPDDPVPLDGELLGLLQQYPMVKSLADFTMLCCLKEMETGAPCRIYASYPVSLAFQGHVPESQ